MTNIITRDFEIRASNSETREVSGVAVPFNDTIDIGGGMKEKFAPGAVDLTSNVKLFRDHKDIIGVVTNMSEDENGLNITAKISETTLGNETLNLVKDGAIRSFSVGFIPITDVKDGNTIIRKKVDLKEVSLVAFPAYDNAAVLAVREETNQEEISMENTTPDYTSAIEEVRNHADELERRLDVIASEKTATVSVPQFRTYGEFVKGAASGNEDALTLARTFDGATTADTIMKNVWVSDVLRVINAGRPSFAALSTAALPSTGNVIEYPLYVNNAMDVAIQAAEGDTLAFGGITLSSETAPVKTYGGYTSMTRQLIERSSVAYVDAAFRSMAAKYAAVTNAAARTVLGTATGFSTSSLAAFDADHILEVLADCAVKVNGETGKALEYILCSSDVFKALAKTTDAANRPILSNTGATVNTFGSINPVGLTGNIFGLPIVVDPSLANGSLFIGNSTAVTTFESAGAPLRLSREDVTNLTTDFSVFGYLAIAATDPKAMVKVANPLD
jgi:HK97 family phage prohead protease